MRKVEGAFCFLTTCQGPCCNEEVGEAHLLCPLAILSPSRPTSGPMGHSGVE